jgi:TP901 family phage tail tape measure protein
MFNLGDVFLRVMADMAQFDKQVQQQAQQSGDKAGKTLGQKITSNLGKIGGAGLGVAFTSAISSATTFEDKLRTIQTVAQDLNLDKAKDDILALSRETGKTTDDLTAGFYDLVSAGVSADDAINVLRDSAKFATGALGSTAEAVDLVTSVLNAYGLEASESTRVTDVFAKAVADGKVTAAELGGTIAQIAPIAASAGISIEEVSAGFAVLTAKGAKASAAATEMRAAISALLTPNEQLNAIQEQTGINFAKLAREKGLAVALEELRKVTEGNASALDKLSNVADKDFPDALKSSQKELGLTNSDVEKFTALAGKNGAAKAIQELAKQVGISDSGFAKSLGSIDAYQFALASTGKNLQSFTDEIVATTDAQGLAAEQYDIKSKSAAEQGKRLVAQIQSFLITVGTPFVSTLGPAVFALNQFGQAFGVNGLLAKAFGATIGAVLGSIAEKAGPSLRLGLEKLLTAAVTKIQLPAQLLVSRLQNVFLDAFSTLGNSSAGLFVKNFLANSALGQLAVKAAGIIGPIAIAATVVLVGGQIAQGVQDQNAKDLSDNLTAALNAGTDAAFVEARKHLADLERGARASHNDSWLNIILGQRADFEKQMQERARVAEQAENHAASTLAVVAQKGGEQVGTAFASGTATGAKNAGSNWQAVIAKQSPQLAAQAHAVGLRGAQALAQGYQDGKDAVKTQWSSFLAILKGAESPTKERARLLGELTSKELAAGLKSKDPYVRATAQTTKQTIIDRLNELKTSSKNIGKAGMEELRKAMKSKDPDIRAAAKAIYEAARKPIAQLPAAGKTYGTNLVKNIIFGMNGQKNALALAAAGLAATAKNYLAISSPAKLGPWSQGGGPEGWGARFTEFLAKGMTGGIGYVDNASERIARAGVPAPVMTAFKAPGSFSASAGMGHGDHAVPAAAGGTTVNVTVEGLLKAKDPLELAQRLQRFASTGVFDPQPVVKPSV